MYLATMSSLSIKMILKNTFFVVLFHYLVLTSNT